jgi:purine-binding chemotaxis protein CheW
VTAHPPPEVARQAAAAIRDLDHAVSLLASLPDDAGLRAEARSAVGALREVGRKADLSTLIASAEVADAVLAARDGDDGLLRDREQSALAECVAAMRLWLEAVGVPLAPSAEAPAVHASRPKEETMTMERQPPRRPEDSTRNGQKFLTFQLGDAQYGVEIEGVQEIKGFAPVTPLPNSPSHVRGVLNLRGVIVPVIDLRRRFGMDSIEYTKRNAIIVLVIHGRLAGLLVDDVCDVIDVPEGSLHPPPVGAGVAGGFVRGLARVGESLMIQVDVEKVVSMSDEN